MFSNCKEGFPRSSHDPCLCTPQCPKNWALFTLSRRDYSNSPVDRYLVPNASLSVLYQPNLVKSVSKSHALWLRWPWALPLLNLCSRVIWPNKASIRHFQLYYVGNNCLLSPPYGVAVETDEHLTAVGRGCHDNAAIPHPCMCVYAGRALFFSFFFSSPCLTMWLVHDMLSSAKHYGSREMERSWLQGLPHPLQIRDFPPTRKSFKPVKVQRARSVKTCPEAALLPLLLFSVWSYTSCDALTALGFTAGPHAAIRVNSLFIPQISLKLMYTIIFAPESQQVEYESTGRCYCYKNNMFWPSDGATLTLCFPVHAYTLMSVCLFLHLCMHLCCLSPYFTLFLLYDNLVLLL